MTAAKSVYAVVVVLTAGLLYRLSASTNHAVLLTCMAGFVMIALLGYYLCVDRTDMNAAILVYVGIALIYTAGLLDRTYPVFGINLPDYVGVIVLTGMCSLAIGMILARWIFLDRATTDVPFTTFSSRGLAYVFFAIGSLIAIVNYATGDIPLLASDVNASRFGSNFGILGPLWPISIAILQAAIILLAIRVLRKDTIRMDYLWAALAVVLLGLSGGRSLLGLALMAVVLIIVQIMRPKLSRVAFSAIAGTVAFGLYGVWRASTSNPDLGADRYLRERGLDGWFGSVDLSLQTGPRVMTRLVEADVSGGGRFIFGDLGSFLKLGYELSDRYATRLLGGDVGTVGGLPPTLFGGLYLDWGMLGVILGSAGVGVTIAMSVAWYVRHPSYGSLLWLGYYLAYILTSAYSYVSFKPTWITVLSLSIALAYSSRQKHIAAISRQTSPVRAQRTRNLV